MNKGKATKTRKTEETPKRIFSKKGADGQTPKKKWNFERGGQNENMETKQRKKKIRILKTGPLGTQKTTLKLQGNNPFGAFSKQKRTKTPRKKQNHQQQKNKKKHLFAC